MKKLTLLALVAVVGAANAQTVIWDSGAGLGWAIIDAGPAAQKFAFSPTTLGGGPVVQFDVFMSPAHTWRSDIEIAVSGPNLVYTTIYNHEDGSGDYISCFSADAGFGGVAIPGAGALDSATTGTKYLPSIGTLAGLNAVAGSWSLTVWDTVGADVGTIDRIRVHTVVPEPGTFIALGLGAAGLVALRRRRK